MTVYWITFRIADETVNGRDWTARYLSLTSAINQNSSRRWIEPTSFIAFESASTIDGLVRQFKAAIAPSKDLILLREMDSKSARICGTVEDRSIFTLMPYLKAA